MFARSFYTTPKGDFDLLTARTIYRPPFSLPKNCQTCGREVTPRDIVNQAFCSLACFDQAVEHARGTAGVVLVSGRKVGSSQFEPCLCMTRDRSRGATWVTEFPGGRRDQDDQTIWESAAREVQEEMGLRKKIPADYIRKNCAIRVMWYQRTQYQIWTSYFIFTIKLINFDIFEAVHAAQVRISNPGIPKQWSETASYYMIPLSNLKEYADSETTVLLDTRGKQVENISSRWINFLKDSRNIQALEDYYHHQQNPWSVRFSHQKKAEAYVWTLSDLKY